MITGLLGKKIGMTQAFNADGRITPVTVIEAGPCIVTQIKTTEKDGYAAVQVGFGPKRRSNKAMQGHLKGKGPFRFLRELPVEKLEGVEVGQAVNVDLFKAGEQVDIIGMSKGKGFQGVVKRHGFSGGPKTHGQSDRQRAPGSIGSNTFPARIFKGLRMAGHTGNDRVTVKKLEIVQVDANKNLMLIKGAVPGSPNSLLFIRKLGGKSKES
jgi:large subunit ribosomal protein L3